MSDSLSRRFASLFTFYGIALSALVFLALALVYVAPARGFGVSWTWLGITAALALLCLLGGWLLRRHARKGTSPW